MIVRKLLSVGALLAVMSTGGVRAQEPQPNDLLLATLWTQRAVEYKANAHPRLCVFMVHQRLIGNGHARTC